MNLKKIFKKTICVLVFVGFVFQTNLSKGTWSDTCESFQEIIDNVMRMQVMGLCDMHTIVGGALVVTGGSLGIVSIGGFIRQLSTQKIGSKPATEPDVISVNPVDSHDAVDAGSNDTNNNNNENNNNLKESKKESDDFLFEVDKTVIEEDEVQHVNISDHAILIPFVEKKKQNTILQLEFGGPEHIPTEINQLITILNHPLFGKEGRRKPTLYPYLLVGSPGAGKTTYAQAIAEETRRNLVKISCQNLLNKYMGSANSELNVIFERINHYKPVIVFCDEIDTIASSRKESKSAADTDCNNATCNFWLKVDECIRDPQILIIAATNRYKDLDSALKGRFKMIQIPALERIDRARILELHARSLGVPIRAHKKIFIWLAAMTPSFSGRLLKMLVNQAYFYALARNASLEKTIIEEQDFGQALKLLKEAQEPTHNKDDILKRAQLISAAFNIFHGATSSILQIIQMKNAQEQSEFNRFLTLASDPNASYYDKNMTEQERRDVAKGLIIIPKLLKHVPLLIPGIPEIWRRSTSYINNYFLRK